VTEQEVLDAFRQAGALLEGHFLLASGRHGSQFLQAARVLQYTEQTEALCRVMAAEFAAAGVEMVCGPAVGGIVLAYETARHLRCRAVFTEKEPDGTMALKRGFRLEPGTRVLVVEDVITTGGSVRKTLSHLRGREANVVGVAVLIDRSGGEAQFDCPFVPLAHLPLDSKLPDECDLCRQGVKLVDPDDIVLQPPRCS
jgi:orotate phosphoribosyltransferase